MKTEKPLAVLLARRSYASMAVNRMDSKRNQKIMRLFLGSTLRSGPMTVEDLAGVFGVEPAEMRVQLMEAATELVTLLDSTVS